MPHCGLRHSCCNARAAVRRARALELLESVHRPRMRAGLEVVPPTTGPGVVTLRKAQEFAERALGPRAPLGELKAAAVVRVRVPENLLAPREWRPPLRRAAGGAAQSAQHHQRCAQKPRVRHTVCVYKKNSNASSFLRIQNERAQRSWEEDRRKRRGVERLFIPPGAPLRRGGVVGG